MYSHTENITQSQSQSRASLVDPTSKASDYRQAPDPYAAGRRAEEQRQERDSTQRDDPAN